MYSPPLDAVVSVHGIYGSRCGISIEEANGRLLFFNDNLWLGREAGNASVRP
jgi:hypothetical protein